MIVSGFHLVSTMTLAEFQVLELESRTPKPKRHYYSALKCLGNNFLGLLLFALLEIPLLGLFFCVFYLGHYLKYANPWHSQRNPRPGLVAVIVVSAFISLGVAVVQALYMACIKDIFYGVFGTKMRRSTMMVSRTLFCIFAAIFGFGLFIFLLSEGYRWNFFGFVEST